MTEPSTTQKDSSTQRPSFKRPDWSIEAIAQRAHDGLQYSADHEKLIKHAHRILEALEWRRDMLIEILQKAEPAGEGWYKVPPGVLTRLGEIEQLAAPVIDAAKETS